MQETAEATSTQPLPSTTTTTTFSEAPGAASTTDNIILGSSHKPIATPWKEGKKKKLRRKQRRERTRSDEYAHHRDWEKKHKRARRMRRIRRRMNEKVQFRTSVTRLINICFLLQLTAQKQKTTALSEEGAASSPIPQVEGAPISQSKEETSFLPPYEETKGARFLRDLRVFFYTFRVSGTLLGTTCKVRLGSSGICRNLTTNSFYICGPQPCWFPRKKGKLMRNFFFCKEV